VTYTESPSEEELYDLTRDPWELVDLSEDRGYAALRTSLAARLSGIWDLRSGVTIADLIGFLVIGCIVGGLARVSRRGSALPIWSTILLGSAGALLGGWLVGDVITPEDDALPWVAAILAAVALVGVVRLAPLVRRAARRAHGVP
jgi:uncharacterized membrane protein YeaQ/YmgE (transglycosylase-associated protein family)